MLLLAAFLTETNTIDPFVGYVDEYNDLLAAYSAHDGHQTKAEWGKQHYCNHGRIEGRTYPGLSGLSCRTIGVSETGSQTFASFEQAILWGLLSIIIVVGIIFFPSVRATTTVSLLVALVLLMTVSYIKNNPDLLRQGYQWSEGGEEAGQVRVALLAPLHILSDTEFLIRRSQTSKSELPILQTQVIL